MGEITPKNEGKVVGSHGTSFYKREMFLSETILSNFKLFGIPECYQCQGPTLMTREGRGS